MTNGGAGIRQRPRRTRQPAAGEITAEWAREPADAIAAKAPSHQRAAVEDAVTAFGARIERRSRALLLLIELFAFEPWVAMTWVPRARRETLAAVARRPPALRPG
jgi:hypothetical protein